MEKKNLYHLPGLVLRFQILHISMYHLLSIGLPPRNPEQSSELVAIYLLCSVLLVLHLARGHQPNRIEGQHSPPAPLHASEMELFADSCEPADSISQTLRTFRASSSMKNTSQPGVSWSFPRFEMPRGRESVLAGVI